MKIRWKQFYSVLLSALLCLSLAQPVLAASGESAVLNVNYTYTVWQKDTPELNSKGDTTSYRLYYIASIGEDNKYVLNEKYAECGVDLSGYDPKTADIYKQSSTLIGRLGNYINQHSDTIEPDFKGEIVEGKTSFSGLPLGLYIGSGPRIAHNGTTYIPSPFLLSLPYCMVNSDNELVSSLRVEINPKFYTNPGGGGHHKDPDPKPDPDPDPDPDPEPDPPIDIPDDPVPLDDIPVIIEDPDVPLVDIPEELVPTTDQPNQPQTPPTTNPPQSVTILDNPVPLARLPQTGLLWWPVPVLAAAGAVLFAVGLRGRLRTR